MSNIALLLVFYILMLPAPLIIIGLLYGMGSPKKNLILGVTVPYQAQKDAEVLQIQKEYKRNLLITGAALIAISIPSFFTKYLSIMFAWLTTWLFVCMIVPFVVFVKGNKKMSRLKAEKGWVSKSEGMAVADIKAAAREYPKISSLWFLPPFVISLIPVAYILINNPEDWVFALTIVLCAALIPMFYFFYRLIFRQRADIVDDNTELNQALTGVRQYHWSRCWIISSWLTGVFNLILGLFYNSFWISMAACTVLIFGIMWVVLGAELKTRKAQGLLMPPTGTDSYLDEDRYWLGGVLYYNPDDKHTMVNQRVGMGMTINLAKTSGKVVTAITALFLIACFFLSFWVVWLDFTPVSLRIENNQLIAAHTGDKYIIPIDEISYAAGLDELSGMSKTNGTATDNVCIGIFTSKEYGRCKLCLNPQNPPYLLVVWNEETYILADNSPKVTAGIIESLTAVRK